FTRWCAPMYAIVASARVASAVVAVAVPAVASTTEATTNDVVMRHRVRPMRRLLPGRPRAHPERARSEGVVAGTVPPGGRSPLPRGFVQPARRRGRPGSPEGLTVAGQRRFPTGLRLRDACATNDSSDVARPGWAERPSRDRMAGRTLRPEGGGSWTKPGPWTRRSRAAS